MVANRISLLLLSSVASMVTGTAAYASPVATFEDVAYVGKEGPAASPGSFRNPVLPGFQPDPSIVRVGEDYYLVTSTFAWFPGLPIYHSRDLVNWRQIANAVDRPSQVDMSRMGVTRALFAPTIEFHDGTFYILNTCVDCRGNFMLTAQDPAGPWSDPIWLDFEGIDPSLFVDTDGRAWIVNNGAPVGRPEYDGHRAIWIQEFDLKQRKLFGPRKVLVDKGADPKTKPIWAEGPHIYKKDGWYYLLAAEGGTADQHSQTIYRSKSVTGPYVPGPINPILTQRDLPDNRPNPVQATGHADFVQTPAGDWWAVFLATRPYSGQSTNLGRETFLLPVTWSNGWPLILPPKTPLPQEVKLPALPQQQPVNFASWTDSFDRTTLDMDWMMLRTPQGRNWWSLTENPGALTIRGQATPVGSLAGQPSFIGKRQRHHVASFTTTMRFTPSKSGDRAGLVALTDENHFYFVGVERQANGSDSFVVRRRSDASQSDAGEVILNKPGQFSGRAVNLRMSFEHGSAKFDYRVEGDPTWTVAMDRADGSILATIGAGLFTGAVVGPHVAAGK